MGALAYQAKSQQTIDIELMLLEKHSVSAIARWAGVSQQRVSYIKKRMGEVTTPTTPVVTTPHQVITEPSCNVALVKSLTVTLTPSVYDALVEACGVANRQDPDEPITMSDYVEELIINRVVELGLLRKYKKRK